MSEKRRHRKGGPRLAFWSQRAEICAGLNAGEIPKMVWTRLFAETVPPLISYSQFMRLLNKEILGKSGAPSPPTAPVPAVPLLPPDAGGAINFPERTEAQKYQPRKFTDFGNLESSLERWYGPAKDEGK